MIRLAMALLLSTAAASTGAQACSISGTAREATGQPLPYAALRLTNVQSGAATFVAADANGTFQFDALAGDGQSYRLDLLSSATEVTGSHLRTRSVMGRAADFACRDGQPARVDVRAVDY